MTTTGRAALFFGPGKPFELTELPVPDPEPGAVVVRVTRANICGSDLHIWRGDGFLSAMARADGRIVGHEMTGTVHALGAGVTTDWAGQPLAEGDRVAYQYFAPCGRCRSCTRGMTEACNRSFRVLQGRPTDFPHFRGAYADYFYLTPQMAVYKVPDQVTDTMVAGVNCASWSSLARRSRTRSWTWHERSARTRSSSAERNSSKTSVSSWGSALFSSAGEASAIGTVVTVSSCSASAAPVRAPGSGSSWTIVSDWVQRVMAM